MSAFVKLQTAFSISMHCVCVMFVQRFEPRGRRFSTFPYDYYCYYYNSSCCDKPTNQQRCTAVPLWSFFVRSPWRKGSALATKLTIGLFLYFTWFIHIGVSVRFRMGMCMERRERCVCEWVCVCVCVWVCVCMGVCTCPPNQTKHWTTKFIRKWWSCVYVCVCAHACMCVYMCECVHASLCVLLQVLSITLLSSQTLLFCSPANIP